MATAKPTTIKQLIDSLETVKEISFSDKVDFGTILKQLESSNLKVHQALANEAINTFANGITKDKVDTFLTLYNELDKWVVDLDSINGTRLAGVLGTLRGKSLGKSPSSDTINKAKADFYVDK